MKIFMRIGILFFPIMIMFAQASDKKSFSEAEMIQITERIVSIQKKYERFIKFTEFFSRSDVIVDKKKWHSDFSDLTRDEKDNIESSKLNQGIYWSSFRIFRSLDRGQSPPTDYITAMGVDGSFFLLKGFDRNDFPRLIKAKIQNITDISIVKQIIDLYLATVHFTTERRVIIDSLNFQLHAEKFKNIVPLKINEIPESFVAEFSTITTYTYDDQRQDEVFSHKMLLNKDGNITFEFKRHTE